jgi:hypothetical protein
MLRQAYGGDAAASSGPLHPEAMQWAALGASAAAYVARAPGVGCMLGPMDVPPKARAAPAQRRQRAAEPSGEVVHAQELATEQLGGEQDKQVGGPQGGLRGAMVASGTQPLKPRGEAAMRGVDFDHAPYFGPSIDL